jgi:methyl-accepting chemotaxis protein
LLDRLRAAYGLEFTLFIEEKPLRDFATGFNPAMLSEQNRVGRFVRFHTTNATLMRDLVGEADISVVNEPTRYARSAQGVPHGVLLMPLRDNAGDPLGVIAAAMDFSGSRAAAGRSLVWQICIGVFAIVLLAGAVIVVLRGFLLRPLEVVSARLRDAAAGDLTTPVPGSDRFCAELQPMVELHERIRMHRVKAGRDGANAPREGV